MLTVRSLCQAFISMLMLLLMLALLSMQKVTLIWTVRVLRNPVISVETGYVAIALLLLVPYGFSLFQMVWNIPLLKVSKEPELPPLKNLLLGLTCCAVESACVVVFTTTVAVLLPVYVVLPAISAVLAVSVISYYESAPTDAWENTENPSKASASSVGGASSCSRRLRICGGVVSVLCPALASVLLLLYDVITWKAAAALGGSVIGLAIVWSPAVQVQTLTTSRGFTLTPRRINMLYCLLKMIGIIVFVGMEVITRSDPNGLQFREVVSRFGASLSDIRTSPLMAPLACNMVTSLVAHGMAYLAAAFCQPLTGIVLPSLLSTVCAVMMCAGVFGPHVYGVSEIADFGSLTPLLAASAILAFGWALPYIINTKEFVQKPKYLYTPFETLWLNYGWNSVFFDQYMLLGYSHHGHFRVEGNQTTGPTPKSRIYVCTTMYREADYEMERLLLSLQGLSMSPKLKHVHLEANIFMDNGCSGRDLKEFAQQLVGLLIKKFSMDLQQTRCLETPYGLQIRWNLSGGMPVFIHLKDPGKVKPKKRWSQSLYINYVMRYRKALWEEGSEHFEKAKGVPAKVFTVSETAKSNDIEMFTLSENAKPKDSRFILRGLNDKISKIGYPTFSDFAKNYDSAVTESDDQGFVSVDDSSSPPLSHSSSQAKLETDSCKDSTDSASVDLGNFGGKAKPMEGAMDGEGDPWRSSRTVSAQRDFAIDPQALVDDDHTYILATDADMEFKAEAVLELLHMCNSDKRLGAACGRTHPIGQRRSPIVWHQIFEYAKDFWMIKNAQNVIGSVMCCPGCFSLYRASAIKQVMDKYSSPTRTPFTVYVKDTGEDRWLATLMMIQGWRLRFSAFADNTTYCPDTFEEFFKQRRRWILSDIANALLVVQNLWSLIRNNDCFTFVYVTYLCNMFLNNIITPGTAIVMITAGLDLVFAVPYIYTTVPIAIIVYIYAAFCTRASTHAQTIATLVLTVAMGSVFVAIAVWGSYSIVSAMVQEILVGHFRFQQHYVILMLTVSLLYAALCHPRETYQIMYGLAYLFIFPAMHVLLPIYSIANIIDQSWGTRDSQKAKIPKISCFPAFKKLFKRRKPKPSDDGDSADDIKEVVASLVNEMASGSRDEQKEHKFWENLRATVLGNDVNLGLEKNELASKLRSMRNRSLLGLMIVNALWLAMLSFFYMGVNSPLSRLNVYGVISGALYGFTLTIQVIGLTICRVDYLLRKLARWLYRQERMMWVSEK